jgi:hypothetical protein
MAAGAAILLMVLAGVLHWHPRGEVSEELAKKVRRLDLASGMLLDLALASEAEKSAVLAPTDEESKTFVDQARSATASLEQKRLALGDLLAREGSPKEKSLFAEFSQDFTDFQNVDATLLDLAVKNTNLKAYALAFGPAMAAVKDFDSALFALTQANLDTPQALPVALASCQARTSALSMETLLPPHIAEESDQKMDEFEAQMAKQDQDVRTALDSLSRLDQLRDKPGLEAAESAYALFGGLRKQILTLSRENTNVRSLAISLNQKRKVAGMCQDALSALQQAIKEEQPVQEMLKEPMRPK